MQGAAPSPSFLAVLGLSAFVPELGTWPSGVWLEPKALRGREGTVLPAASQGLDGGPTAGPGGVGHPENRG